MSNRIRRQGARPDGPQARVGAILSPSRRKSKYGAIRTVVGGLTFASKREAERYQLLKLGEQAGRLTDLRCQPRYPLVVAGVKVADYVADFEYRIGEHTFTEDAKGVRTPVFKLKAKLFKALYGREVIEV